MKRFLVLTLFSGVLVVSGAASAETVSKPAKQGDRQQPAFEQLDADSDGYLSRHEARDRASLKKEWKRLDKDDDQRLDPGEFSAFEKKGLRLMRKPAERNAKKATSPRDRRGFNERQQAPEPLIAYAQQ